MDRSLFQLHSATVARALLGARLVRIIEGKRITGIIVEAEGYEGEEDLACHASHGKTPRTAVMYGPPGFAYVYFTYGNHWMLNVVTGLEGHPAAVLLRAIHPIEGLDFIAQQRPGRVPAEWCNGPGKLCKSLAIDRALNGHDLCHTGGALWIENDFHVKDEIVITGARVGLGKTPEPWLSKPWRFRIPAEAFPAL
jgi:DNA-3-methyladenine glycosylase